MMNTAYSQQQHLTMWSSLRAATRRLLITLSLIGGLAGAGMSQDPGVGLPATSELSDQKLGSVLIFPLFLSTAAGTQENTRFSITNQNTASAVYIILFFVNGTTGAVQDSSICLTATQTATFLATDVDPGVRGFAVAVAVD